MTIGFLFIANIAGLGFGVVMGIIGWPLQFLKSKFTLWVKTLYSVGVSMAIITLTSYFPTFSDAKFIACLSFGYTCSRVWGKDKPMVETGLIWFFT